jgi:neurofibromin 1
MKPSRTLERNVHWNEIAAYTRLVYGSGLASHQLIQNELFVPEVIHLVTLLAAQGDTDVRMTVYGVTLQLFQALYTIHVEDTCVASSIKGLLDELTSPETLRYFGLTLISSTTNAYAALDISDDLVTSEGLSRWLLKALSACSGNSGMSSQKACM